MDKSIPQIWRKYFATWPTQFKRRGVVIPSFGEAIAFIDFVMNEDVVVLERPTPDSVGARRVAIPFQMIETVKYTEPLKTEQFLKSGFVKGAESDSPTATKKVPVVEAPATPGMAAPSQAS